MIPTTDLIDYMIAHADTDGHVHTAPDDPIMLQAELDGFATRMDGYWQAHGEIRPGEQRVVRHWRGGTSTVHG